MKRSKHILKHVLAFALAAACLSSQLTAPASAENIKEYSPSGTVTDLKLTLPTVYLHIIGGMDEFNKVNSSKDHSYRAAGSMDIVIPEGFTGYADSDEKITGFTGVDIEYIRGRGNSTWTPGGEKNPYKIKLAKKTDIFGMGKSKHWALLANIFDGSLSKDRMSGYIADHLGLDYTPVGYPVEVMLDDGNGGNIYLGSYLLMETVRVESSRVDITLPQADETEEGDYFFSLAQDLLSPDHFKTRHEVDFENVDPSFDAEEDENSGTAAQKEYIRSYVQDVEDAVMLGRVRDENSPSGWKEVKASDYMDYESAAKYWLIQDFSANRDSYKNGSTYFYKTAGENGKVYSGPVWDLDLAYRNIYNAEGFASTIPWMLSLMRDETFFNTVKYEWSREGGMRDQAVAFSKDGGLLDQYAAEIGNSAAQDRLMHPAVYEEDFPDFNSAIDDLKLWIKTRINWYDNNLYSLPERVKIVTLKYGDGEYDFDRFTGIQDTQFMTNTPDYPKEGYFLAGWYDEEGNEVTLSNEIITEDRVYTAKYIPENQVIRSKELYFSDLHPSVTLNEEAFSNNYTVYPQNAQDQAMITWTSSDESVAIVASDTHFLKFLKPGKTTITAHLPNGNEFSYELTVYEDDATAVPESIDVTEKSIELTVGERAKADFRLYPENSKYSTIIYNMEMTEGEQVIDIDMNGMISALSPGKAKVSICAITYVKEDGQMSMMTAMDSYEVIVKEPPQKEMKVSAVWNDGDNKDGIRPSSVFITIFRSGEFIKATEVGESTDWQTLCSVPENADITIKVFKTETVTGTDGEGTYSYDITGSADEGFVVTFTHTAEEDESSEDDSSEDESSEPESTKEDESSEPADDSRDGNPGTGAAASVFAVSLVLAAAAITVSRRREK